MSFVHLYAQSVVDLRVIHTLQKNKKFVLPGLRKKSPFSLIALDWEFAVCFHHMIWAELFLMWCLTIVRLVRNLEWACLMQTDWHLEIRKAPLIVHLPHLLNQDFVLTQLNSGWIEWSNMPSRFSLFLFQSRIVASNLPPPFQTMHRACDVCCMGPMRTTQDFGTCVSHEEWNVQARENFVLVLATSRNEHISWFLRYMYHPLVKVVKTKILIEKQNCLLLNS